MLAVSQKGGCKMSTLIVALPFFDSKMSVTAYRLYSRNGAKLLGMMDSDISISDAIKAPGFDLVQDLGVEPLTGGLPLFVDFNEYHVLMRAPVSLGIPPEQLICILPKDLKTDETTLERLSELKELGFQLAVEGLPDGYTQNPLFDLTDYIIYSISDHEINDKFIATIKALSSLKKLVLRSIHDMDTFNTLAKVPNILYCGSFFSRPLTKGAGKIAPLKINALNLLNQLSDDDFDLGDIADIVGKDPSLSISLLRFINTIMPRKIDSLRNAVAILGQKEVKRWATTAISIQLSEDKPNEISKLSLIRARFAENLAGVFGLGVFSQNLFMLGLFSLLDIILEIPMEKAVDEVALDVNVKAALVEKSGTLYKVLEFIQAYEHAYWDEIAILIVKYNLNLEEVTTAFVDALKWYKQLLDAIPNDTATEPK